MKNHSNSRAASVKTLTGTSILAAVIIVLTVFCNAVRFGPFSITLALAPIIIGAALYGNKSGAVLGGVFGTVVLITGLFGMDGGTVMYLFSQNALATAAICIVKGAVSGYLAGAVYHWLSRRNQIVAVILAGVVCPVVNTGLFIAGMSLFFLPTLNEWANGQNLIYYLIFVLTGINFLVEISVNLVLSSAIVRLLHYSGRH